METLMQVSGPSARALRRFGRLAINEGLLVTIIVSPAAFITVYTVLFLLVYSHSPDVRQWAHELDRWAVLVETYAPVLKRATEILSERQHPELITPIRHMLLMLTATTLFSFLLFFLSITRIARFFALALILTVQERNPAAPSSLERAYWFFGLGAAFGVGLIYIWFFTDRVFFAVGAASRTYMTTLSIALINVLAILPIEMFLLSGIAGLVACARSDVRHAYDPR